jgi:hypothetical protein
VSWREQAACRDTIKTEVFYDSDPRIALAVCASCPSMLECRADGDATETPSTTFGVLGGETERMREARRGRKWQRHWKGYGRGRRAEPIVHGTYSGWRKHKRRDEVPCEPCMDAMRARGRIDNALSRERRREAS